MNKPLVLHSDFKPAGDQPRAIHELVTALNGGLHKHLLLGVTGCGKTFTLANVIQELQCPTLVIAHNKTLAAQLYGEMRAFFPDNAVEYFVSYYDYYQPEAYIPATNTYIEKDSSINEQIDQMRLSATKSLLERRDTIIVASVSAIYGLGDPESYHHMALHLVKGETVDARGLLARLAELQYARNDIELRRGYYRTRGDIIDIFPAESANDAIRITMDDGVIDDIAYFDPLTGRVLRKLTRITIFPKSHYVTSRQNVINAINSINAELSVTLPPLYQANKLVEAQRLKERTEYDIEMLLEIGYCSGIENYSRHLSGRKPGEPPPTLIDYLPADALLIIDESHATIPQIGAMYAGDRSRKTTLINYGFRLPSALDNRPLQFSEFEHISPRTIYVSATPAKYELEQSANIVELLIRPTGLVDPEVEVRPVGTQIDDLLSEIKLRAAQHERVLVTTLTKRMSEDLTSYLAEHQVKVRYLHSDIDTLERVEILRDLRLGVFDVLVGINLLREGLDLPEVSLVAILDADKEGFLRSVQSLIQTSGRAARNIHGKVIMYADKITKSMHAALTEMDRRRKIQQAYNLKHGITPVGISRAIADSMSNADADATAHKTTGLNVASPVADYTTMPTNKLTKLLAKLEKKMYQYARDLDFEEAAATRDEIAKVREALIFSQE